MTTNSDWFTSREQGDPAELPTYQEEQPAITWFCSSDPSVRWAGCDDAIPTREATEYWDVITQTWTINEGNDARPYCPNCGSHMELRDLTPGEAPNPEGQYYF
jgi:hypothetical protein